MWPMGTEGFGALFVSGDALFENDARVDRILNGPFQIRRGRRRRRCILNSHILSLRSVCCTIFGEKISLAIAFLGSGGSFHQLFWEFVGDINDRDYDFYRTCMNSHSNSYFN